MCQIVCPVALLIELSLSVRHEGTHHFIFGLQVKGSTQSALDGLSYWQLDELLNWLKFYVNKYPCIGFVIGPYYETNGDPTIHLKSLERTWIEMRLQRNNLMKIFPPCNQFYEDDKSIYWCPPSVSANGETILRPRQLLEPGKVLARCACVQPELLSHPRLQTYLNCPPEATRCVYTADNQEHTSWSHLGLLINFG
ncbi:unnamed protein product [Protopolystoma xenopodis]|uniref:Uncharacterized protein n=1 Tax=Protopolystoma xenopodis TaxID=117903 RepID=A0A3S5CJI4_9PLAT|nr:unnamed protein product [Protopolystoma xenopodis]